MVRTSTITLSLVVVFVVALLISNEVEADSQCMSKCNSKCLESKKATSVSCGVACFIECLDWGKQKLSPEMQNRLADLKKRAKEGAINQQDVQGELKEIAKHMMVVNDAKMHDHDHKSGQKPVNTPKDIKEEDRDITDDDDQPDE